MAKRKTGRVLNDDGGAVMLGDGISIGNLNINALTAEPDQEFVETAGRAVLTFLKGLGAFFLTARSIEAEAKQSLGIAQELQKIGTPKTEAADEGVQLFIKKTTEQKKAAEAHWAITTTVHGFHRRLTARRAIATDAIEKANTIANQLHNAYVAAEQRRVAEENERRRREAEAAEQKRRDEEAARAAAEAERIEAEAPTLSRREEAFVNYFYGSPVGTPKQALDSAERAARLAGYRDPAKAAAQLVVAQKVIDALKARQAAEEIRQQQRAKAAAPVHVDVVQEAPRVAGVVSPRTRWGAEVLDAQRLTDAIFIEFGAAVAALVGKPVEDSVIATMLQHHHPSIPRDVLAVDESAVRKYGESLHELIDRWPGVRHTKSTKGV